MSGLQFRVTGAQAKRYAASPTIVFALEAESPDPVDALVLRAQIRIEPQWREYTPREKPLLTQLFGEPDRWGTTLRPFSWADVSITIPGFEERTSAEIPVACTYDFDVTATRFFSALRTGDIPLRFLFSGAIFHSAPAGFSTQRVPWSCESAYRMPLEVWRSALRECYGDDALLRVSRETLDALQRVRALSGDTSWDSVLQRLMGAPT